MEEVLDKPGVFKILEAIFGVYNVANGIVIDYLCATKWDTWKLRHIQSKVNLRFWRNKLKCSDVVELVFQFAGRGLIFSSTISDYMLKTPGQHNCNEEICPRNGCRTISCPRNGCRTISVVHEWMVVSAVSIMPSICFGYIPH